MNVQEFEELKNRKEKLSMLKVKEEAKIEALNKDLELIMVDLNKMGITTIDEAKSRLDTLEKEYNVLLKEIGDSVKELSNVQLI